MKRALKFLPLVSIVALAFVLACGGETAAPAAPAPAPAAPAPAPAAPAPAAPAPAPAAPAPAPAPADADLPDPKNPVGTITYAQSALDCNPGAGTVYCGQYEAQVWGVAEDNFTWRRRDDGTIDYAFPQLAVSWEMAPDFRSVVIENRTGVQFHKDWGEMTAEDIAFSYNQVNPILTPHSIAPSASYFSTLFGGNSAEALDSTHVRYSFASVDTHWHTYMMNANGFVGLVVHPKRVFDENGEDWMRDNNIATGPFQVESWTRDDRAVLIRFDDHWELTPAVERVIVQAMPEDATRVAALKTGEIDAAGLAIKSVPEVQDAGFLAITSGNASQQGVVYSGNLWESHHALTGEDLKTASSGVYARELPWIGNPYNPNDGDNPEALRCPDGANPVEMSQSCGDMEQARLVRWAVAMAIDKESINDNLLNGLGWPVHVGYVDEQSEFWNPAWEYPFDIAMAEEYLDRAGYPRGGSGTRFEMPIFISSGHTGGLGEEIGDAFGGMMADIGIETAVLKYPYAVYRPGLVNRGTTVPRLTSGDDGQAVYPFDWPKGIEESSLSRGGYCMCYEAPWISRIYLGVAEATDLQERINLNKEYFDLMHFWALKPGVVAVPALVVYNPNAIESWKLEPNPFGNGESAFWNIMPAR